MKIIVETTGSFQLIGPSKGEHVRHNRPTVLEQTAFLEPHMLYKRVKVIAQVVDEATDEEFVQYLEDSKGDVPLALAAYLSEFGLEAVSSKDEEPTPRKKGGKAKEPEVPAEPAEPGQPAAPDTNTGS